MNVVSLGFRTDLMLLELGGSVVIDRSTHMVVRTPQSPDFWWGNFLLLASPLREGEAEHWTGEFAEHFPDVTHFALGVDGTDGEAGDAAELAALGTTLETSAVLTAEEMAAPDRLPPGVDVRPLSGDDDWRQADELRWESVESGSSNPAHRAYVTGRQEEYRRLCEEGYGAWFGAFVDGRMRAGTGVFTDGSGLARFQNVHTHPDLRRQGLASAVVRHAGHWALTELRATTLVIVAGGQQAVALYEKLGFAETERQVQLARPA
ncbi:GNAT family N-acetyltransferase [Streptomyces sp. TR02-1]|uniref:GNAT family N-acetyltransferase n=1 Tax=Streptomyces sp. TR02-1 TaxID=3385977 RepID=UPI0039A29AF7